MNSYLDEMYFAWLYGQVVSVKLKNPARTYQHLLGLIHEHEFIWLIPNDDDRAADGRDLRYEFLEAEGLGAPGAWLDAPCSMLELLVGLARAGHFLTNMPTDEFFWEMLENLDLRQYRDRDPIHRRDVEEALNCVIFRTYDYDGSGGLFPLRHPDRDQQEVELWYQLNAYVLERSYV